MSEISECMLLYNKSGGKVLRGLERRRKAEQLLFNTIVENGSYYPKYFGNSTSVDMVLKSVCVPDKYIGSWTSRKPLAKKNGMPNYVGSMNDNIKIIALAKEGKLKKV